MARNGAGTFAVLNPIQIGQLRSSSAVNANFTDAGDEITNSLPLDGQAGMSGQFKAADGTAQEPGFSFANDTNTGFRRSDTDEMKWVGGGTDRATMDANGKLTLAGGLDVAGALTHTSGRFGPQVLAGTSAARATLRLSANDTNEHEIASYQSGSGAGADGSLRVVGGGANDVATMRFYVNDVLSFQWTGTLFTHSVDTLFGASGIRGDTDGFLDLPEISAPTSPSSNIARVYARDDSGTTRLYHKDSSGVERNFQGWSVDRQVFTASGTWTKPTAGQTQAIVEMWAGGGSGGSTTNSLDFAGGGGGGGYIRRSIAVSSVSAAVSVTVGAGGTAEVGSAGVGNVGGVSSFGSYVSVFGGGGGCFGDGTGSARGGSGGGGGLQTAGSTGSTTSGANGGQPRGVLGSETWGALGNSSNANCNAFGGGGGANLAESGNALFGGGAGGAGGNSGDVGAEGGDSVFGGGGGGGDGINGSGASGVSIYGGAGGTPAGTRTGSIPAGGGAGNNNGTSGAGARGEVRITCW